MANHGLASSVTPKLRHHCIKIQLNRRAVEVKKQFSSILVALSTENYSNLVIIKQQKIHIRTKLVDCQKIAKNIVGRLPENSRNSFVEMQSQENSTKDRPKKFVFSLKADLLYFD